MKRRVLRGGELKGTRALGALAGPLPLRARDDSLVERYLAEVSQLPQVRMVGVDPEGLEPRFWTLIDAEPWESAPRHEVYEAEMRALQATVTETGGFRLINLREYAGIPIEQLVPNSAAVRFRR